MTSKYTDENPGSIDPDALRQAEDVIEQLRWTYIREWAPAAMSEIEGAVQGVNTVSYTHLTLPTNGCV